ncbi:hypothetical protein D3C72_1711990 [compost metagenome]
MHRKIRADAVAGAMGVIRSRFPERDARQRVEIATTRSLGKPCGADADHAFQHQCEETLLLFRNGADRNRAGDVSGAVDILRTGIDEEHLPIRKCAVRIRRDAVMDDGGMFAGT